MDISRYIYIYIYILFSSRYPTSPSEGSVLYEITCSIARSLAPPGSRWEGRSELGEGGGKEKKKKKKNKQKEDVRLPKASIRCPGNVY